MQWSSRCWHRCLIFFPQFLGHCRQATGVFEVLRDSWEVPCVQGVLQYSVDQTLSLKASHLNPRPTPSKMPGWHWAAISMSGVCNISVCRHCLTKACRWLKRNECCWYQQRLCSAPIVRLKPYGRQLEFHVNNMKWGNGTELASAVQV